MRKYMLSWLGACCALTGATRAEEVAVGAGLTHAFTNEAAQVQSDAVRVADRAVLEMSGAGTLTLQTGAFTENRPVQIDVRAGAVKVVETEPLVTAYPKPTAVMEKAAFWLDAAESGTMSLRAGTEDEVETWRDVRETGAGTTENPFAYPRAVAWTNQHLTAFPQRKAYLEKDAVYCRGYGNGCFMNWVKPNGTQATISNLRNVFIVQSAASSYGYTLGQRSGQQPYFQIGGGMLWCTHNYENMPMHASRTYVNGAEVDPFTTSYTTKSIMVMEVECLGDPQSAQCFFNDRDMQLKTTAGTELPQVDGKKINPILGTSAQTGGGNRAGGEYVHEMLLFTNQLTAVERMAVSDWLNQKWKGTLPPASLPATTVTLATNGAFVVDGEVPAVTLKGDGLLRKEGAGALTLRSSYRPRNAATHVAVAEGTLALGYGLPFTCAAGDVITSTQQYYGPELAPPVAGGDATRLVKNGTGPVTLDAIPAGVTKIQVNGGELTLADPERPQNLVAPADPEDMCVDPAATGTTFCFEEFTAENTQYVNVASNGVRYGWHAIVPPLLDGKQQESQVFFYNTAFGSRPSWGLPTSAPEGTSVLTIKNNASAWTEIEVPRSGLYTLTFWAAPRSSGYTGRQLEVLVGPDADNLTSCGAFQTSSASWAKFTFRNVPLSAGRQQFWFRSLYLNDDRCTLVDQISFVRQSDEVGVYSIPNGDFEIQAPDFVNSYSLSNTNRVPGFTVKQPDSIGIATHVNEVLGGTSGSSSFGVYGTSGWRHFNLPWNRPGSRVQFMMTGNGSELSTTFTPPAGTWRFVADASVWQVTYEASDAYNLAARVTMGERTVDLGVCSLVNHKLVARTWPNAFTTDGTTPVTLTLAGSVAVNRKCGHAMIDNLKLLPDSFAGTSLLANGGFEGGTGWTFDIAPKPPLHPETESTQTIGGSSILAYDRGGSYTINFGSEWFEGSYCLKIVNEDTVYQRVTFPTGGLYRLSANMASRCSAGSTYLGNGLNPVACYLAKDGVTNWLGRTDSIMFTNFHEYAFIARVPEAGGTYDVGFQGQIRWDGTKAGKVDRTALVDAAQLYRIETEKPIEIPENLEIEVAPGACLKLDFDGTNEINRLVLGGVSRAGFVSLAECPHLLGTLSGRGTLFIRPKGTTIIFR